MRQALIVAGPTASGKSALALALATRLGGTVINADSMQVYRELPIVTAQPSERDRAAVPHRLYGVRSAACPGSVAWWREEALAAMAATPMPILCGGTGLYLQALTQGLSDIPPIDPAIRAEARALAAEGGAAALHARLAAADPETAAGLRASDPQRLARAWEVWRGTGQGLAAWQKIGRMPAPYDFRMILLEPPRDALRAAIALRFDAMVAAGAVAEVESLVRMGLSPDLPAMRALGVPALGAALRNEITLDDAREQTVAASLRYSKRQATWFRHRVVVSPAMTCNIQSRWSISAQLYENMRREIDVFVSKLG